MLSVANTTPLGKESSMGRRWSYFTSVCVLAILAGVWDVMGGERGGGGGGKKERKNKSLKANVDGCY